MEIKGRKEGGEREDSYLSFFGEVLGEEGCKEGILVGDCSFEGIQQ